MVRAAWVGTPIVAVPVKCTYAPDQIRQLALPSGARSRAHHAHEHRAGAAIVVRAADVAHRVVARRKMTAAEHRLRIFSEHTHEPSRLAAAVGLGLFFGIAAHLGFSNDGRRSGGASVAFEQGDAAAREQHLDSADGAVYSLRFDGAWALAVHRDSPRHLSAPDHQRTDDGKFLWQWIRGQRGARGQRRIGRNNHSLIPSRVWWRTKMKSDLYHALYLWLVGASAIGFAARRCSSRLVAIVISSRISLEEDILATLPQHDKIVDEYDTRSANSARLTAFILTWA